MLILSGKAIPVRGLSPMSQRVPLLGQHQSFFPIRPDDEESASMAPSTASPTPGDASVTEEIPVSEDASGQVVASEAVVEPREALNYTPEEQRCQELHAGNFQEYVRCLGAITGFTVLEPGRMKDLADTVISEWNAGVWDPANRYTGVEYPVDSGEVIPDLPSGLSWVEMTDADGKRFLSIWRTSEVPSAAGGGGVVPPSGDGRIPPVNVVPPGGGGTTTTTDPATGETTTTTTVTDPATGETTTTTTVTDPATGGATTTATVTDPATGEKTTTITGSTGETTVTTSPTGETTTTLGATGGTTLPDGRTVLPGGGIQTADGTIYLPGGGVIYPDGRTVSSGGWKILPGGGTLIPGGGIVLPNGEKVLPPSASVAEKLAGATTVGALGVVALAVAGVLTVK